MWLGRDLNHEVCRWLKSEMGCDMVGGAGTNGEMHRVGGAKVMQDIVGGAGDAQWVGLKYCRI